jgi:integrase
MKLTAQEIARHKPRAAKDYIIFADDFAGFGLRYRGGKRTWVYQYAFGSGANRVNGRVTIGEYPALPPAKARSRAEDLYADVKRGHHPAVEKKVRRDEARNTFGKLVAGYLRFQKSELRPRSYAETERYLDRYAGQLHGLPASGVDTKRIAKLLNEVADNKGAITKRVVTSNRLRKDLMAMFAWAMRNGLHDHNPVIGTAARKERARDRVLTDAELAAVWNNLPEGDYGDIVKLLILTGQRASEIGDLHWSEIDLDKDLISLPAGRTKNARPHEIPISAPGREILAARKPIDGRDFVFGIGAGGFAGWGKSKERLDRAIAGKRGGEAVAPWTIHDLRRTTATRMADLGEQPHIIEAVLNHVSGQRAGVAGIYNRALYKAEKAQALAKWATHVLALAKGKQSNVRPLRRA